MNSQLTLRLLCEWTGGFNRIRLCPMNRRCSTGLGGLYCPRAIGTKNNMVIFFHLDSGSFRYRMHGSGTLPAFGFEGLQAGCVYSIDIFLKFVKSSFKKDEALEKPSFAQKERWLQPARATRRGKFRRLKSALLLLLTCRPISIQPEEIISWPRRDHVLKVFLGREI